MATSREPTKYGPLPLKIVERQGRRLTLTGHCRDRWAERFGGVDTELGDAVAAAIPAHEDAIPLLTTGNHEPAEMLLWRGQAGETSVAAVFPVVVDGGRHLVTTCYRAATEFDYAIRQYIRARLAERGGFI